MNTAETEPAGNDLQLLADLDAVMQRIIDGTPVDPETSRRPNGDIVDLVCNTTMAPLCAVERRRSSGGAIPPRQLSLQPVAIEAAVGVILRPKPSMQRIRFGIPRASRP